MIWSSLLVAVAGGLALTLWMEQARWVPTPLLERLRREDGFWETLGAFSLLAGGFVFVALGFRRRARREASWPVVMVLGGLLCIGAAEEVNWGQRLLGFETPMGLMAVNTQGEANLHNLGGYWANYMLMLGFLFYVGVLPPLELAFADVRALVWWMGLPIAPLAFVPFGLIGALLGDHPLLLKLWPPSTWRLSEGREALFSMIMLGLALDQWLTSGGFKALRRGRHPDAVRGAE